MIQCFSNKRFVNLAFLEICHCFCYRFSLKLPRIKSNLIIDKSWCNSFTASNEQSAFAETRLPFFIILYSFNDKTWTNRPNNNSFRKDAILVYWNELKNMFNFHLPMILGAVSIWNPVLLMSHVLLSFDPVGVWECVCGWNFCFVPLARKCGLVMIACGF